MFDDIYKKPGILGYCEDCRNGHFIIEGGNSLMCHVKGHTVNRKDSCPLWASRGLQKAKGKIKVK